MKIARTHLLARLALVAAVSVGLAACGGSSNNNEEDEADSGPTLEERQTSQQTAIDTASAAVRAALTNLSTPPTQAQVDALDTANTALDNAIKGAADLSDSAKAGATGQLTFAQSASVTAKANIAAAAKAGRIAVQKRAIDEALKKVMDARDDLADPLPTQDQVDALNTAIGELETAIDGADDIDAGDSDLVSAMADLSNAKDTFTTAQGDVTTALQGRRSGQASVISVARSFVVTARTKLADADEATPALVADLDSAIKRLEAAVAAAADWTADEAPIQEANELVTAAKADLTIAEGEVDDATEKRMNDQIAAIGTASEAVTAAQNALGSPPTAEQMAALASAIEGLDAAISAAVDLSIGDLVSTRALLNSARARQATAMQEIENAAKAGDRADQRRAISTASAAVTAAQNALGDPPTQAQVDALQTAIGGLQQAIGGAKDLEAGETDTANALVLSATRDHATALVALNTEKNRVRVENNKDSMQVEKALVAHTLGGDAADEATRITFGRVGTPRPGLEINGNTDGYYAVPSSPAANSALVVAPEGFVGINFKRDKDKTGSKDARSIIEEGRIFTDIENHERQLWATYFSGVGSINTTSGELIVDHFGDGGHTLNPATTGLTNHINQAFRFSESILPSKPSKGDAVNTLDAGDDDETIEGSYFGVRGDYACEGSSGETCTITRSSKDEISIGGDAELRFTPDSKLSDTYALFVTRDQEYTVFGYWMESTEQRDGSKEYDIETFHRGSTSLASPGVATLGIDSSTPGLADSTTTVEGTAKYYGAAAGVYVKEEGADDSLKVTHGDFTAEAELTARFGGDKIPVEDDYEVDGKIFDFMDGNTDLGFAVLTLGDAHISSAGGIGGTTTATAGETNGGGTSGNWHGQFYGNANPGNDGGTAQSPAPDTSNDYPANVSGQFNGHFENGHVVGAFGAEYDD